MKSFGARGWLGYILLFLASSVTAAMVLSHMALSGVGTYGLTDDCDGTGGCRTLLQEDFEECNLSQPPPNWTIEAPGYGVGGIWVEESFQKDNRRLHIMSSANNPARISQNVSPTSTHIEVALKASIEEEIFFPDITEQLAFAVGFRTRDSGRVNLLELGRSDNQTIFPFNVSYAQGIWIHFRVMVDLETTTVQTFFGDEPVGNISLPSFSPSDIESLYLHLGSGAWYKGRFDDIQVREYAVPEPMVVAVVLTTIPALWCWSRHVPRHNGESGMEPITKGRIHQCDAEAIISVMDR